MIALENFASSSLPTIFDLIPCPDIAFRYNARGLKTIALEYILRNLDNPIVEEGLNVSCLCSPAKF